MDPHLSRIPCECLHLVAFDPSYSVPDLPISYMDQPLQTQHNKRSSIVAKSLRNMPGRNDCLFFHNHRLLRDPL